MKVVGVIGSGASGLCAARHIIDAGLTPVVWEQSADLGGTWRLSEEVGVDKFGLPVHSSIYQNLKCDLPKVMMAFPDFPFSDEGDDFAHHTVVIKYLENYAVHYDLKRWIKFGHRVEKVTTVYKDGNCSTSWEVIVTSLKDGTTTKTTCDALLVCNGHFSVPKIPEIPGIENYDGEVMHSHDYREASPYIDKQVLVLGASASGMDISLEISSIAKQVHLSHNFPMLIPSELPPNLRQVPGVKRATHDGFVLNNGQHVTADAMVLCTGYEYKFPFLSEECGIKVEDNQVKPLYKQILNVHHPTMGFIGIPSRIASFPLFYYQVQFFLASITGKTLLPSAKDMFMDIETRLKVLRQNGRKDKEYHFLQNDQFDYVDDLAACAGIEAPPAFRKEMWGTVIARLFLSFAIFKTYEYKVLSDGTIVESRNGKIISTGWDLTLLSIKQLLRLLWRDFYRTATLIGSHFVKSISKLFQN